jgi:hypothetical protein
MSSHFFKCKWCEQWVGWSEANHQCKPFLVTESGERHECKLAPGNLNKKSKARARAYKKTELGKIDDFAILADIHDKVRYWNSRLVNFTLKLEVIPKQLEENEGVA